MMSPQRSRQDEDVDQLLLNARLRDELEPFLDESVNVVNVKEMPTRLENEYLASMLAWERAPVLPIADWFKPRLVLLTPDSLSPDQLREILRDIIERLYEKRIVLDFTDHLSDYQLYCMIARDILPSSEKKIEHSPTYLHWHCLDPEDQPDIWLRYYASPEDRKRWTEETGLPLPPRQRPQHVRKMPRRAY
jgi:hypothetical protein